MVIKNNELKIVNVSSPKQGTGEMVKTVLLTEEEMNGKGKTFARLCLKPGCSMGFHSHNGDTEMYYILSGSGEYDDNGEKKPVESGDLCIVKSGQGHSIKNVGSTDLEAIALILYC